MSIDELETVLADDPIGPTWIGVCALADLEPEWGEAALIGDRQLAVFRLWDDRVMITSNLDPRSGAAVMARGIVGTRAGLPTVTSPLHKETYDLITGKCLSNRDLELPVHPSRVSDGVVQVVV
jgi:nitrite reductase (NADH) small subunit